MGTATAVIAAAIAVVVAIVLAAILAAWSRARERRRFQHTLRGIGTTLDALSGTLVSVVDAAAAAGADGTADLALTIDLDELVAQTAELAARVAHADGATVEVRRGSGAPVVASHGVPLPAATLESALEPPDRRGWHSVQLEWSPDARAGGDAVRSALAVPLVRDGERLGTLVAYSRVSRAFDAEREGSLRALASEAAPAIENALRHADVLELVTTDKLTRIRNRAGYDEALELEVARAQRGARPLAVLLVDLDDFKTVNTRFGHPAGDDVLATLAAVMRRTARLTDVVCRRGGEEFALVLPETACGEAIRLYARLRAEVELTEFPHVGAVTFSAGLTELRPGDTVRTVDERVSRLVLDAKNDGKNRLVHDCGDQPAAPPTTGAPPS